MRTSVIVVIVAFLHCIASHAQTTARDEAIAASQSEEIATLDLDPQTALKMGWRKIVYERTMRKLGTSTENYNARQEVKSAYNDNIRGLIGEEKYKQWQHYKNTKTERKYMREYGFTAAQVAAYSHEAFKATEREEVTILDLSPDLAIMMGELIATYEKEKDSLKDDGLCKYELELARERLTELHQGRVCMLIGNDKYQIWKAHKDEMPKRRYLQKFSLAEEDVAQYSTDAFMWAGWKEIQNLELPPIEALKVGELKASYRKSLSELKAEDPLWSTRKKELDTWYHQTLKNLIGNEKFMIWIEYQSHSMERHYKDVLGFTDAHFMKYQEIENRQAVEILRIKSLGLTREEKIAGIQKAKEDKVERLRLILPSKQFNKWHKSYLERTSGTVKQ